VDDLIERLRDADGRGVSPPQSWTTDAADEIDRLRRELAAYKAAAPLCAEHQPNGGARATCLVCAVQELSAAISRIDYELGEPNEMEVSGFDVHCNPEPVVAGARNLRRELAEAKEECSRWRKSFAGHVYVENDEYSRLCRESRELAEAREWIAGAPHHAGCYAGHFHAGPETKCICKRDALLKALGVPK